MSSAVETVEKVLLKLFPTINGFRFQVGVPVEDISFESSNKLFYQQITSVPEILHVSMKCAIYCFGLSFPSNCWNFGSWYPFDILILSIIFIHDLEYKKRV